MRDTSKIGHVTGLVVKIICEKQVSIVKCWLFRDGMCDWSGLQLPSSTSSLTLNILKESLSARGDHADWDLDDHDHPHRKEWLLIPLPLHILMDGFRLTFPTNSLNRSYSGLISRSMHSSSSLIPPCPDNNVHDPELQNVIYFTQSKSFKLNFTWWKVLNRNKCNT